MNVRIQLEFRVKLDGRLVHLDRIKYNLGYLDKDTPRYNMAMVPGVRGYLGSSYAPTSTALPAPTSAALRTALPAALTAQLETQAPRKRATARVDTTRQAEVPLTPVPRSRRSHPPCSPHSLVHVHRRRRSGYRCLIVRRSHLE